MACVFLAVTLLHRLIKAAAFLPAKWFRMKKDFLFVIAEKDGREPIPYYPPALYTVWQVEAEGIYQQVIRSGGQSQHGFAHS